MLGSTIGLLGFFTAPISMIINGVLIGNKKLLTMIVSKDNLFFMFMKLIILPILTMIIGSLVIKNQQLFLLIVLVASMTSGAVNALLAETFNGNGEKASDIYDYQPLSSCLRY